MLCGVPHSAGDGGNQRCAFPAAVLRLQEAHLAAGSQVQHRLSQDPRETRGREEERKRGREEEGEREREREREGEIFRVKDAFTMYPISSGGFYYW